MVMKPLNLGTQTNRARNPQDGNASFINCFIEPTGEEGNSQATIYPFEGFKKFGQASEAGPCRGVLSTDDFYYAVIGGNVVRCNLFGDVTKVGTVPSVGLVSFARNIVSQICLVVSGQVFRIEGDNFSLDQTLTALNPRTVTFIDGYFVFALANGQIHWTEPNSFDYVATNFATAEANPDGLKCALKYRRELWLFGSETIEAWKSTGSADSAFKRLGGGVIENGMSGECTAAEVRSNIIWIDEDYTVQISGGDFNSQVLSTPGIARDIEDLEDKSSLAIWDYSMGGHRFVVLQSDVWTYVLNMTTRKWHTRISQGFKGWNIKRAAKFAGKTIGVSRNTGIFYELARKYHDEDGVPLHMVITTPPQTQWPGRVTYDTVYLNMLTNQFDPNWVKETEPQVGMRFSDDGGGSWYGPFFETFQGGENAECTVQWSGLGQAQEQGRVFEFSIPVALPRSIRGAMADIS